MPLSLALSFCVAAQGQDAILQSGNLHVGEGTTVSFSGVSGLLLSPGSTVVNDGTIDLGTDCLLTEQPGAPISGMGTERAVWPLTTMLQSAEPGRLGLTLSSSYDGGDLVVVRGHEPITLPNSAESIARWYQVMMPGGSVDTDVELRYDLSELNGIDPMMLSLFESGSLGGPWTALASVNQPGVQQIAATDQAPVSYLTAFDLEAANTARASTNAQWSVWPTQFDDVVHVLVPADATLRSVELLDASGKVLPIEAPPRSTMPLVDLTMPDLSAGIYLLRLNGEFTIRLLHP